MGLDIRLCCTTIYLRLFSNCLFENYGTAYSILKSLFGDANYNKHIPKFDGMLGAILSISFSIYAYVYILTRAFFIINRTI